MTQPDDADLPGSQQWLARAKTHLAFAKLPAGTDRFSEDQSFHAQQAAEIALKAVYCRFGLPFEFTHDIGDLMVGLRASGISVPDELEQAKRLTRYAVQARYPGTFEHVTTEECLRAIELATRVVE